MGSSISKIYDDYDDYEYFCKVIGVESMPISKNNKTFYAHETELLKELGDFKCIEDYYTMLNKAKNRENNINSILK